MKNYLSQYNRSTSHGLWIGTTVSLRREPYIHHGGLSSGNYNITIDGVTRSYNTTLNTRNLWSDGSLSFWISFNTGNFSTQQEILRLVQFGTIAPVGCRLIKNNQNELLLLTNSIGGFTGTFSTGFTFSTNTLYHIVMNLSTSGITSNTGINSQNSLGLFSINGNPYLVNRNIINSSVSVDSLFDSVTRGEPQFGSSNTNFNLFDIVYTPTRLNIDQVRALYNGGHGVELNEIKYNSPFNSGFIFDNLLFKKQLNAPQNFLSNYSSFNRGPQFGNIYLDYTNNGLSIPKQVYDNAESYQPYRNGINVTERSNIFPISTSIKDYIYSGVNFVSVSNLSATFSNSGLDQIIPDSVDTIRLTNCTFLDVDTHIGSSSSNYTAIFLNGVSASNVYIWGSKKPYLLDVRNCTINRLSILRTPQNSGECSTSLFLRQDSVNGFVNNRINEYFLGVTPSPVVLSNTWNVNQVIDEMAQELRFSSTPTGQFYEITNSDQIGDSCQLFRSELSFGEGTIARSTLPTTTSILNPVGVLPTGLQGLSSSITKPLSFSSSRFLYEISVSSRNHKYMILPTTTSLRSISLLGVDLTTDEILNLNTHATTLTKLELINFDATKPSGQNLDLSSFSSLAILGGYFSGSVTFSFNNTLLDLRSLRNSDIARSTAGATGPGLTTLNRIPLSTTTILLSNNTTFTGITGTGGIDFGPGRTTSISQFQAANCAYGFITVPTDSTFQFTSIFNISGTTQCLCPTFSGITWSMFPTVNTNFNVSNTNHTSITDLGLPLGTTIRSSGINISQTFSSLAMGLTALANTIENIYTNWFNFATSSITKSLTWTHPLVTTTTGITPSGFTLGVSDGTFSVDNVTRIRELKYVLTTQTISAGTSSLKYRWSFTP